MSLCQWAQSIKWRTSHCTLQCYVVEAGGRFPQECRRFKVLWPRAFSRIRNLFFRPKAITRNTSPCLRVAPPQLDFLTSSSAPRKYRQLASEQPREVPYVSSTADLKDPKSTNTKGRFVIMEHVQSQGSSQGSPGFFPTRNASMWPLPGRRLEELNDEQTQNYSSNTNCLFKKTKHNPASAACSLIRQRFYISPHIFKKKLNVYMRLYFITLHKQWIYIYIYIYVCFFYKDIGTHSICLLLISHCTFSKIILPVRNRVNTSNNL